MPAPTVGIFLNQTVPAAPDGDQNVVFQSDDGTPEQSVTAYPQRASKSTDPAPVYLFGTTRPDGVTLDILDDGTMFVPSLLDSGDGGDSGGDSGSGTTSGLVCVVPAGAIDGSNTIFTLPAPVADGTGYLLIRNGVVQRQLGSNAEYAVQDAQITTAKPPLAVPSPDWLEFYYTPGTPNTDAGGSGNVNPTNPVSTNTTAEFLYGATSVTVPWPAGAQAGDLIVLAMAISAGDISGTPTGWTLAGHQTYGFGIGAGWILYKTLTSGDITSGSVLVNFSTACGGVYSIIDLGGATTGIREVEASVGAGANTATVTTSSSVVSTDISVYFGANGANNFNGGFGPEIDHGTPQSVSNPTSVLGQVGASLYMASPSPAGATGIVFTYNIPPSTPGPGTYQAVVIVTT